jgi:serine phosphatase RsbU (regulator of sigma subunit)
VVIYTDGLTESFNSRREMLGVDGLQEIVTEASALPLADMKTQILNRVAAFRHGRTEDDVSLVLLEIS